MEKLAIVMTTDKNYIIPTKVAIYSMVASTSDALFEIHILCNENLDSESREGLCKLEGELDRVKILFEEVNDACLSNAKTLGHIPIASYYRLYISRLLEGDRCLFIDGDVIVNTDIKEVYSIDLMGYYIAGVRDCAVQSKNAAFADHEIDLNLPDMHQYVNAGFMLFNLKKIREDRLDEKFIDAIGDGYRYMDQDILNKFCYGKIKHLPLKYNLFAEFYERLDKMGETDYSREELVDVKNWGLLHYPGSFKPWICSRLKANQIWWNMARKVLTKEEYDVWQKKVMEHERLSDWTYILAHIKGKREVVIFGYSEIGCKLEEQLKRSVAELEIIFADNDVNKQGTEHGGRLVLSANDAVNKHGAAQWIISSQVAYVSIKNQLLKLGVKEEQIVRYVFKTEAYYEGLDVKNYKYEMKILGNN